MAVGRQDVVSVDHWEGGEKGAVMGPSHALVSPDERSRLGVSNVVELPPEV
jgi:hypothetical protein